MRSSLLLTLTLLTFPTFAQLQRVDLTVGDATFRAVVVPADARLAFTELFAPWYQAPPQRSAREDYSLAMEELRRMLKEVDSTPAEVVRLNVYAATASAANDIRPLLRQAPGAVTLTITPLPHGAAVGVDAVAIAHTDTSHAPFLRILPPGGATFISGMAAKAPTLAESTRGTLEQLAGVLDHFGLTNADVIHVKSFLKPMSDVATAQAEFTKFFPEGVPPSSWVEWTLPGPIEIELVARAAKRNADPADTASYHNPPPSKPSPLFARAVLTHGGRLIYTSSICAGHPLDPNAECTEVLTSLRDLLAKSGTDFNHLVKGTYYPSADPTSAAFNTVRPKFYNPQRPPAASKANVAAGPFEGRNITLDMIAVTPPEKKQ